MTSQNILELTYFLNIGILGDIGIGSAYSHLRDVFGDPTGEILENSQIMGTAYGNLFFGLNHGKVDGISLDWDTHITKPTIEAMNALERVGIQWYPKVANEVTFEIIVKSFLHQNILINRLMPLTKGEWGMLIEVDASGVVVGFDHSGKAIEGIWCKGRWPKHAFARDLIH